MPTLDEMLTSYSGKKRLHTQQTMKDIGSILLGQPVEEKEGFSPKERITIYIKLQELRDTRQKLANAKAAGNAKAIERYTNEEGLKQSVAANLARGAMSAFTGAEQQQSRVALADIARLEKEIGKHNAFGELSLSKQPAVDQMANKWRQTLANQGTDLTALHLEDLYKDLSQFRTDDLSDFKAAFEEIDSRAFEGQLRNQLQALSSQGAPGLSLPQINEVINWIAAADAKYTLEREKGNYKQGLIEQVHGPRTKHYGYLSAARARQMFDIIRGVGSDTTDQEISTILGQLGIGSPEPSDYEDKILAELEAGEEEDMVAMRDKIISSEEFAAWFKDSGYQDPLMGFKARMQEKRLKLRTAKKHDKFLDQLRRMGYDEATAREFAQSRTNEWLGRKDITLHPSKRSQAKQKPRLTQAALAAGNEAEEALADKLREQQLKRSRENEAKSLSSYAGNKGIQAIMKKAEGRLREVMKLPAGTEKDEEEGEAITESKEAVSLIEEMLNARKRRAQKNANIRGRT